MPAKEPIVFVVDDDEDVRSSLERVLLKRGFSVQVFASASAFLAAYEPDLVGCIILDQGMPEMTGLELQQILVSKGRVLPIIFITGHAGIPETVLAMKAGAVDFLEKPFRLNVLVDLINSAFDTLDEADAGLESQQLARAKFQLLTPREKEVADFWIANPSGVSSKYTANALDISPRTIDHHRSRIFEKMQINSIAALVKLAVDAKLDDGPLQK